MLEDCDVVLLALRRADGYRATGVGVVRRRDEHAIRSADLAVFQQLPAREVVVLLAGTPDCGAV
jgi:hypothetical protein